MGHGVTCNCRCPRQDPFGHSRTVIGIGAVRIPDRAPPTPPGMRVNSFAVVSLREDLHLLDRAHAGRTKKTATEAAVSD
jgi:hypothetical protein